MSKHLIFLLSTLLIGCCSESEILNNGLTKSASEINEYTVQVRRDSINNESQDTPLMVRTRTYNNSDQIIYLEQRTLFDNEKMEIEYAYDEMNNIKREVVKLSSENSPFIVDYFYKDTLLYQSKAIVDYPDGRFEQMEIYYYRKNKTKDKVISTQTFINLETSDTIRNSISTTYFDKNEIATEVKTVYKIDSSRNRKIMYDYDCQNLIGLKEFNEKDSLISTLSYEYDRDKFDNWTSKRIYEDGKLERILTREIKYK